MYMYVLNTMHVALRPKRLIFDFQTRSINKMSEFLSVRHVYSFRYFLMESSNETLVERT